LFFSESSISLRSRWAPAFAGATVRGVPDRLATRLVILSGTTRTRAISALARQRHQRPNHDHHRNQRTEQRKQRSRISQHHRQQLRGGGEGDDP